MIVRTSLTRVTVKYDDAEFIFRELNTGEEAEIAIISVTSKGDGLREKFVRALEECKGVIDPEGNDIPCTEKNKIAVFNANPLLMEQLLSDFVANLEQEIAAEKKISANGGNGT